MTQQNPVRPKSRLDLARERLNEIDSLPHKSKADQARERLQSIDSERGHVIGEAPPAPEGGYEVPQGPGPMKPNEEPTTFILRNAKADYKAQTLPQIKYLASMGAEAASEFAAGTIDLATLPWNLAAPVFQWLEREKNRMAASDKDYGSIGNSLMGTLTEEQKRERESVSNQEAPMIPSAVSGLKGLIDEASGGFTKTLPEDSTSAAVVRGAAGMASPVGMAKLAGKGIVKASKYIPEAGSAIKEGIKAGVDKANSIAKNFGSTKISDVIGGGVASGVTHRMMENNNDPYSSIGAGIVSGGLTSQGLRSAARSGLQYKLSGFGPKKLDMPAIEAAETITKHTGHEVSLPNSVAARETPMVIVGEKVLSKVSKKIRENLQKANEQWAASWDSVLKTIGPRMGDVEAELSAVRQATKDAIPEGTSVSAKPLLDGAKALEKDLNVIVNDEAREAVVTWLRKFQKGITGKLPENFENFSPSAQKAFLSEMRVDVKTLLDQEVSLNAFLKNKGVFQTKEDKKIASVLSATVSKDIEKSLLEYGKENAAFNAVYMPWKRDYAKAARREEVENILRENISDSVTDEPRHRSLARALLDKPTRKRISEALVKGEGVIDGEKISAHQFEELLDAYATYSKSMTKFVLANKNPSGTAYTSGVIKWAQHLFTMVSGLFVSRSIIDPQTTVPTLLSLGGAGIASWMLSSPNYLRKAVRFAKKPTVSNADAALEAAAHALKISVEQMKELAKSSVDLEESQKEAVRDHRKNSRKNITSKAQKSE